MERHLDRGFIRCVHPSAYVWHFHAIRRRHNHGQRNADPVSLIRAISSICCRKLTATKKILTIPERGRKKKISKKLEHGVMYFPRWFRSFYSRNTEIFFIWWVTPDEAALIHEDDDSAGIRLSRLNWTAETGKNKKHVICLAVSFLSPSQCSSQGWRISARKLTVWPVRSDHRGYRSLRVWKMRESRCDRGVGCLASETICRTIGTGKNVKRKIKKRDVFYFESAHAIA